MGAVSVHSWSMPPLTWRQTFWRGLRSGARGGIAASRLRCASPAPTDSVHIHVPRFSRRWGGWELCPRSHACPCCAGRCGLRYVCVLSQEEIDQALTQLREELRCEVARLQQSGGRSVSALPPLTVLWSSVRRTCAAYAMHRCRVSGSGGGGRSHSVGCAGS